MITFFLENSNRKGKRYKLVINYNGKIYKVHFGSDTMSNYTIHKDETRKRLYRLRHSQDNIQDTKENVLNSAGWWALNLLWSKPNLEEAKRYAFGKGKEILSK